MAKTRTRPVRQPESNEQSLQIEWRQQVLSYVVLLLCGLIPYVNSFRVPFLYDDIGGIVENPSIRSLGNLQTVLLPPPATTVSGRPILNATFAVNYAISQLDVWSYHAFNLLIHLCAGLTLFGLLRKILCSARLPEDVRNRALLLSAVSAAVWLTHPLQTQSVTYIVQRAESLVGLLLLLTCYSAVRSFLSGNRVWMVVSVLCCAVGMGTKEVMATAPALVLLLDRTFYSDSFMHALRRHALYYAFLASTWIIVGWLAAGGRPGSAGFGAGMTSWEYLRTQFGVVLYYLRLCVVPAPLVFDYGWKVADSLAEVFLPMLIVLSLIGISIGAVVRNRPAGMAGAWFFIILAPSSTVIPIVTEVAAEHRLYLPLASVVTLAVICSHHFAGRLGVKAFQLFWGAMIMALGLMSLVRNRDYQSALTIWKDSIRKRPDNALAQFNYGRALDEANQLEAAVDQYLNRVMPLKPDYIEARANAGLALTKLGRLNEAVIQFRTIIAENPELPEAYNNLGLALSRQGQTTEAVTHYREAVKLKPGYAEAHYNLGNALAAGGNAQDAVEAYRQALTAKPDFAPGHYNLAVTLEAMGNNQAAIRSFRAATNAKPDYVKAHLQLGLLLARTGDAISARNTLQTAVKLQPDLVPAHQALRQLDSR